MLRILDPFRFVLIAGAGWMNQWEYQMIDYLREENRVLREQLGPRRLRFNDDQRRRLAVKAKGLTRRLLDEMSPIVTWFVSLASETDRAEIRRQWPSRTRTTTHGGRDRSVGAAHGKRKPSLGLSAYPGRTLLIWGHQMARSTIADILKRHGAEPASERKKKTTWKE